MTEDEIYYENQLKCQSETIDKLKKENERLKIQLEEYRDHFHRGLYNTSFPYSTGYDRAIKDTQNQQKEFIKYLEDEKDRLIKETSHYYIDSFDRQHAVNETIYDEVDIISQKYKEITGDK